MDIKNILDKIDKIDFSKIDWNKIAPKIQSDKYNKFTQSILDGYEPICPHLIEETLEELINSVIKKINNRNGEN